MSRELDLISMIRLDAINLLIQTTIFSLIKLKCFDITTTAQNKMKMMFQTHFSSFSEILMLNTENFKYSFLIENDVLLTHCKIKRIIYKTMLNKTLKYTEYINRIMCRLVDNTLK